MPTKTGLDLGARSFKAVKISATPGSYKVLAIAETPLPLDRGEEELPTVREDGSIDAVMLGVFKDRLKESKIGSSGLLTGLSGRDSILRYTRTPPVPKHKLDLLMNHEIGEMIIRNRASATPPTDLRGWGRSRTSNRNLLPASGPDEPNRAQRAHNRGCAAPRVG